MEISIETQDLDDVAILKQKLKQDKEAETKHNGDVTNDEKSGNEATGEAEIDIEMQGLDNTNLVDMFFNDTAEAEGYRACAPIPEEEEPADLEKNGAKTEPNMDTVNGNESDMHDENEPSKTPLQIEETPRVEYEESKQGFSIGKLRTSFGLKGKKSKGKNKKDKKKEKETKVKHDEREFVNETVEIISTTAHEEEHAERAEVLTGTDPQCEHSEVELKLTKQEPVKKSTLQSPSEESEEPEEKKTKFRVPSFTFGKKAKAPKVKKSFSFGGFGKKNPKTEPRKETVDERQGEPSKFVEEETKPEIEIITELTPQISDIEDTEAAKLALNPGPVEEIVVNVEEPAEKDVREQPMQLQYEPETKPKLSELLDIQDTPQSIVEIVGMEVAKTVSETNDEPKKKLEENTNVVEIDTKVISPVIETSLTPDGIEEKEVITEIAAPVIDVDADKKNGNDDENDDKVPSACVSEEKKESKPKKKKKKSKIKFPKLSHSFSKHDKKDSSEPVKEESGRDEVKKEQKEVEKTENDITIAVTSPTLEISPAQHSSSTDLVAEVCRELEINPVVNDEVKSESKPEDLNEDISEVTRHPMERILGRKPTLEDESQQPAIELAPPVVEMKGEVLEIVIETPPEPILEKKETEKVQDKILTPHIGTKLHFRMPSFGKKDKNRPAEKTEEPKPSTSKKGQDEDNVDAIAESVVQDIMTEVMKQLGEEASPEETKEVKDKPTKAKSKNKKKRFSFHLPSFSKKHKPDMEVKGDNIEISTEHNETEVKKSRDSFKYRPPVIEEKEKEHDKETEAANVVQESDEVIITEIEPQAFSEPTEEVEPSPNIELPLLNQFEDTPNTDVEVVLDVEPKVTEILEDPEALKEPNTDIEVIFDVQPKVTEITEKPEALKEPNKKKRKKKGKKNAPKLETKTESTVIETLLDNEPQVSTSGSEIPSQVHLEVEVNPNLEAMPEVEIQPMQEADIEVQHEEIKHQNATIPEETQDITIEVSPTYPIIPPYEEPDDGLTPMERILGRKANENSDFKHTEEKPREDEDGEKIILVPAKSIDVNEPTVENKKKKIKVPSFRFKFPSFGKKDKKRPKDIKNSGPEPMTSTVVSLDPQVEVNESPVVYDYHSRPFIPTATQAMPVETSANPTEDVTIINEIPPLSQGGVAELPVKNDIPTSEEDVTIINEIPPLSQGVADLPVKNDIPTSEEGLTIINEIPPLCQGEVPGTFEAELPVKNDIPMNEPSDIVPLTFDVKLPEVKESETTVVIVTENEPISEPETKPNEPLFEDIDPTIDIKTEVEVESEPIVPDLEIENSREIELEKTSLYIPESEEPDDGLTPMERILGRKPGDNEVEVKLLEAKPVDEKIDVVTDVPALFLEPEVDEAKKDKKKFKVPSFRFKLPSFGKRDKERPAKDKSNVEPTSSTLKVLCDEKQPEQTVVYDHHSRPFVVSDEPENKVNITVELVNEMPSLFQDNEKEHEPKGAGIAETSEYSKLPEEDTVYEYHSRPYIVTEKDSKEHKDADEVEIIKEIQPVFQEKPLNTDEINSPSSHKIKVPSFHIKFPSFGKKDKQRPDQDVKKVSPSTSTDNIHKLPTKSEPEYNVVYDYHSHPYIIRDFEPELQVPTKDPTLTQDLEIIREIPALYVNETIEAEPKRAKKSKIKMPSFKGKFPSFGKKDKIKPDVTKPVVSVQPPEFVVQTVSDEVVYDYHSHPFVPTDEEEITVDNDVEKPSPNVEIISEIPALCLDNEQKTEVTEPVPSTSFDLKTPSVEEEKTIYDHHSRPFVSTEPCIQLTGQDESEIIREIPAKCVTMLPSPDITAKEQNNDKKGSKKHRKFHFKLPSFGKRDKKKVEVKRTAKEHPEKHESPEVQLNIPDVEIDVKPHETSVYDVAAAEINVNPQEKLVYDYHSRPFVPSDTSVCQASVKGTIEGIVEDDLPNDIEIVTDIPSKYIREKVEVGTEEFEWNPEANISVDINTSNAGDKKIDITERALENPETPDINIKEEIVAETQLEKPGTPEIKINEDVEIVTTLINKPNLNDDDEKIPMQKIDDEAETPRAFSGKETDDEHVEIVTSVPAIAHESKERDKKKKLKLPSFRIKLPSFGKKDKKKPNYLRQEAEPVPEPSCSGAAQPIPIRIEPEISIVYDHHSRPFIPTEDKAIVNPEYNTLAETAQTVEIPEIEQVAASVEEPNNEISPLEKLSIEVTTDIPAVITPTVEENVEIIKDLPATFFEDEPKSDKKFKKVQSLQSTGDIQIDHTESNVKIQSIEKVRKPKPEIERENTNADALELEAERHPVFEYGRPFIPDPVPAQSSDETMEANDFEVVREIPSKFVEHDEPKKKKKFHFKFPSLSFGKKDKNRSHIHKNKKTEEKDIETNVQEVLKMNPKNEEVAVLYDYSRPFIPETLLKKEEADADISTPQNVEIISEIPAKFTDNVSKVTDIEPKHLEVEKGEGVPKSVPSTVINLQEETREASSDEGISFDYSHQNTPTKAKVQTQKQENIDEEIIIDLPATHFEPKVEPIKKEKEKKFKFPSFGKKDKKKVDIPQKIDISIAPVPEVKVVVNEPTVRPITSVEEENIIHDYSRPFTLEYNPASEHEHDKIAEVEIPPTSVNLESPEVYIQLPSENSEFIADETPAIEIEQQKNESLPIQVQTEKPLDRVSIEEVIITEIEPPTVMEEREKSPVHKLGQKVSSINNEFPESTEKPSEVYTPAQTEKLKKKPKFSFGKKDKSKPKVETAPEVETKSVINEPEEVFIQEIAICQEPSVPSIEVTPPDAAARTQEDELEEQEVAEKQAAEKAASNATKQKDKKDHSFRMRFKPSFSFGKKKKEKTIDIPAEKKKDIKPIANRKIKIAEPESLDLTPEKHKEDIIETKPTTIDVTETDNIKIEMDSEVVVINEPVQSVSSVVPVQSVSQVVPEEPKEPDVPVPVPEQFSEAKIIQKPIHVQPANVPESTPVKAPRPDSTIEITNDPILIKPSTPAKVIQPNFVAEQDANANKTGTLKLYFANQEVSPEHKNAPDTVVLPIDHETYIHVHLTNPQVEESNYVSEKGLRKWMEKHDKEHRVDLKIKRRLTGKGLYVKIKFQDGFLGFASSVYYGDVTLENRDVNHVLHCMIYCEDDLYTIELRAPPEGLKHLMDGYMRTVHVASGAKAQWDAAVQKDDNKL